MPTPLIVTTCQKGLDKPMAGTHEDWFPTSIWYFRVEGWERFNAELLRLVEAERHRDARGVTDRSSVQGWHSAIDLHRRPEFAAFVGVVRACALEVASFQRWDFSQGQLAVLNLWANVNGKYASNAYHNHPNCFLSGAYYVQADEQSGAIVFRDPREGAALLRPPLTETTPWTYQTARYQPSPGLMLIFPNWLYHAVEPNRGERERISLSFNIGYGPAP